MGWPNSSSTGSPNSSNRYEIPDASPVPVAHPAAIDADTALTVAANAAPALVAADGVALDETATTAMFAVPTAAASVVVAVLVVVVVSAPVVVVVPVMQ